MNFIFPCNSWFRFINALSAVYSCMFPDINTENGLCGLLLVFSVVVVLFVSIFQVFGMCCYF